MRIHQPQPLVHGARVPWDQNLRLVPALVPAQNLGPGPHRPGPRGRGPHGPGPMGPGENGGPGPVGPSLLWRPNWRPNFLGTGGQICIPIFWRVAAKFFGHGIPKWIPNDSPTVLFRVVICASSWAIFWMRQSGAFLHFVETICQVRGAGLLQQCSK